MGYRNIQLKLHTGYGDDEIRKAIRKKLGLKDFSFTIDKKSLDARKKDDIHWQVSVVVSSPAFRGEASPARPSLSIPYKKRSEKVVVVGSGPAGFFAGYVLQLSGYAVTIIERGSGVEQRSGAIDRLENDGLFSPGNNYAFGEGGAGTFSDGKLTSRSKHISAERRFFMEEYVKVGAPEEILYMAYPHVGTDNLKVVVPNLRQKFIDQGGRLLFDTMFEDLVVSGDRVMSVRSSAGDLEADHFLLATGHSAYDTYRMLIGRGVHFTTKNFAIGHRIEHPQRLINLAQWGRESLPGVKAAEYRLAMKTVKDAGVYTFCMCPGGYVVPSAAYHRRSVVNGMSYYRRDGDYANAGIVAGVHPDMLAGNHCTPLQILDWMDRLEESFYDFSDGLAVPATRVADYLNKRKSPGSLHGSYSRGLLPAGLRSMVPGFVGDAIAEGLRDFAGRIRGFDQGILMGLESKTSSPLQAMRESNGRCAGFDNLYIIGEGSGFAGGIVSSVADGIRCAMALAGS
jgi:uncharacterized FAD-dependent dehydrogenase